MDEDGVVREPFDSRDIEFRKHNSSWQAGQTNNSWRRLGCSKYEDDPEMEVYAGNQTNREW